MAWCDIMHQGTGGIEEPPPPEGGTFEHPMP